MSVNIGIEQLRQLSFHAPRGKRRLQNLGNQISQMFLLPEDRLIGVIGDAGSGKSLLIKGMFPGLELTNDDDGINTRPAPLIKDYQNMNFIAHSYHLDIRFEMAFVQLYELVEAVKAALAGEKRVVVEHFELLYPLLQINADILVGIGEEVVVCRPNIFGPLPDDVHQVVYKTLKYRRMAHTSEDLVGYVMERDYQIIPTLHSDVRRGFVLAFVHQPKVDLIELEQSVKAMIDQDLSVTYHDSNHIKIGDQLIFKCTGPRTHVTHTKQIEEFRILPQWIYDHKRGYYLLVGLVGESINDNIKDLNHYGYYEGE
jgi:tRNA A37 threonylcarbamoyladenosine biosynthesis protein TsaE